METTVYKFDELSDEAKRRALNAYETEFDFTEWRDTLTKFAEVMGFTLDNYSYGDYRSYIKFSLHDTLDDLEGLSLHKYLYTNSLIFDSFFPRRYRGIIDAVKYDNLTYKEFHAFYVVRHKGIKGDFYQLYSKYMRESEYDGLTGCYTDYGIMAPVYEFLKNPKKDTTFRDLINECFENFASDCEKAIEWESSDEFKTEEIQANEYEFTESGEMV
jgi:hypothetical protein